VENGWKNFSRTHALRAMRAASTEKKKKKKKKNGKKK